jgi:hypothetical protein
MPQIHNLYPVNDSLEHPPIEAGHARYFHLLELVEEFAHAGRPYTVQSLIADGLNDRVLQMSPAEAANPAGMEGVIYTDKKRGESVRAISLNHFGISLANPAFQPEGGNAETVLLIEKKTARSLFEARMKFLVNESISIEGVSWLENPRLHVRSKANREFASKWGLQSAWEHYVRKDLIGKRAAFTAVPTLKVVESALKTIQDNTELPF